MSESSLIDITMLSPNNSGKRKYALTRITPHCTAVNISAYRIGEIFQNKQRNASCNYGIGNDCRVVLCVPESMRSWCSSSYDNDNRAITIECASLNTHPYEFMPGVYNKLVELCVDICRRNKKKRLLWISDKKTALKYKVKDDELLLTVHRWFASKACPGEWMMLRMTNLANEVTQKLNPGADIKQYHTIVKGDRLGKIAKTYGTTVERIMFLNSFIKDPNKIQIGWEVRVR